MIEEASGRSPLSSQRQAVRGQEPKETLNQKASEVEAAIQTLTDLNARRQLAALFSSYRDLAEGERLSNVPVQSTAAEEPALDTSREILERIPSETGIIEHMNYGKRVLAERSYEHMGKKITAKNVVPNSEGYETTRRSVGMRGVDKVIDLGVAKMLDVQRFSPHSISDYKSQVGILAIRTLADGSVGAVRARFRPEAGDGEGGRVYQQSNSWQIPQEFWTRHAGFILDQLAQLRAVPDLVTEDRRKLAADVPHVFNAPEHAVFTYESLIPDEKYLADVILAPRKGAVVIPTERFESEGAFLKAFGAAYETVWRMNPESVADLRLAIGVSEELGPEWIQFSPKPDETVPQS